MKIFNQSFYFFMLIALSCFMACTDPYGNVVTQGQGVGAYEAYSIAFAHVDKDSTQDPAHPGKSFRLRVSLPYIFQSGCVDAPTCQQQVYVGLQFDAPLPGGSQLAGTVPSLNHNFEHTFPNECADNRVFWFSLPPGYDWESDIFVHTHATNITADRSHADGLVVIANIDAHERYIREALAIPSTIIDEGIKQTKGEGSNPVTVTETPQTIKEPIKQPATKEGN